MQVLNKYVKFIHFGMYIHIHGETVNRAILKQLRKTL
jgi:hypothetical protein